MAFTSATDDQDEHIAVINIIPLVDVVLVLLIIFMVTAVFSRETAMKVDLPKESSKHAAAPPLEITVSVDRANNINVDGKTIAIADLQATIHSLQTSNPGRQELVVLRGDKQALYGTIVPVLDNISQTGLPVTIAMKPDTSDR